MYRWEDTGDDGLWGEAGADDAAIANEVDSVLLDRLSFGLQPIEVDVLDGVVTLRGIVRTRDLRNMAAALVDSVPGVREVVNAIEVASA